MELKEKIELRRREREAEAAAKAKQQKLVDDQAKMDAAAETKNLTQLALSVLVKYEAGTSLEPNLGMTIEDAKKVVEKAAQDAIGVWFPLALLGGLGYGIYTGFSTDWGFGVGIILLTLGCGIGVNHFLVLEKKRELIDAHRMSKIAQDLALEQSSIEDVKPKVGVSWPPPSA